MSHLESTRQQAVFQRDSPGRGRRQGRKYESLDSVLCVEAGGSPQPEPPVKTPRPPSRTPTRSSRGSLSKRSENDDDESNIDLVVARYKESLKIRDDEPEEPPSPVVPPSPIPVVPVLPVQRPASESPEKERVSVDAGKRVLFHKGVETRRSSQPEASPSWHSRYTEGDYHHLKRHKINRSVDVATMVKQRSLSSSGPSGKGRHKIRARAMTFDFSDNIRREISIDDDLGREVESVDASTPMLTPVREESASPLSKLHKTEVTAEIHHNPSSSSSELKSDGTGTTVRAVSPTKLTEAKSAKNKHSQSLEVVSPMEKRAGHDKRRVMSYEGELHDYNRAEITEFNRGPFYSADFDLVSENGSPELKSKVRYNDMGSFEDVNEAHIDLIDEIDIGCPNISESDTETLNGTQKYRELWSLRATFEEEDELSDTIRMEDMAWTPEQSPDREHVTTSYTTSFESNTDAINYHEESSDQTPLSDHNFSEEIGRRKKPCANLLNPSGQQEVRRQNYRKLLSHRLQKVRKNNDNSFDSVETIETDGDVSDTSRPEVTTTSFESTTDNTDSTGDSQTHKLQQMRGDSGYKSLETQQTLKGGKKELKFSLEQESIDEETKEPFREKDQARPLRVSPKTAGPSDVARRTPKANSFERRTGKTASKKRRDYGKGRQIVHVYESIHEPETDSKSDPAPSGDSFEDNMKHESPKISVFSRFFRSHSRPKPSLSRDYSVDSKTDALYHEFMRYDPTLDSRNTLTVRKSPRLHARPQMHRKNTEPLEMVTRRRAKLPLEFRSASLGSDSSASSARRLSPQDSIEEEFLISESGKGREGASPRHHRTRSSIIRGIPIIKLPEEDSTDV